MKTVLKMLATLFVSVIACGANASVITIDLSGGWNSYDELDGIKNIVLAINLNALSGMPLGDHVEIDGIGWDLNVQTVGDSWLSEASIDFDNGSLALTPGAGFDEPGDQFFSSGGIIYLADVGLANISLENGILMLQFFETFDDAPLELDAIITGTLSISTVMAPVPLPAGLLLMISGLLSAGMISRRRSGAA